jgi:hypothetical protein
MILKVLKELRFITWILNYLDVDIAIVAAVAMNRYDYSMTSEYPTSVSFDIDIEIRAPILS